MARAIENGEVDAGWVATRALSDAGIEGFDALDGTDGGDQLCRGGRRRAGRPRRPSSTTSRGPASPGFPRRGWAPPAGLVDETLARTGGLAGRTSPSSRTRRRRAFTDLGATPRASRPRSSRISSRASPPLELDKGPTTMTTSPSCAPYVTSNVVLWPKMFAPRQHAAIRHLHAEHQQLVRRPQRAGTPATVTRPTTRRGLAPSECEAGAPLRRGVGQASGRAEGGLRAASPAWPPIRSRARCSPGPSHRRPDPTARGLESHNCTGEARPPTGARRPSRRPRSSIPPGTYRMTLTEKDLVDSRRSVTEGRGKRPRRHVDARGRWDLPGIGDDIDPIVRRFTNLLWEVGRSPASGATVFFQP